ncbi:hypothetical protein PVAND_012572 [Polypedilum vanderplanki]|uniref:Ionotropic glutamate receptor C-terminal domain-containing protein n=1 Tax=Polypedilum vanderplanki TaxID=319348 RepID=A0A9J6CNS2_POLVA|nr:hypothetical protein PVAND_012572 [Polypedilum vanderplanki]
MMFLKYFLLILKSLSLIKASHYESEAIAQAMCDVIELTHKNENWVLDLIIFGQETNELKDIASELFKKLFRTKPMLNKIVPINKDNLVLLKSAIILMRAKDLFRFNFITKIDNIQKENLNFYIYLQGSGVSIEGIEIFNTKNGHVGHYEYFFNKIGRKFLGVYEMIWFYDEICSSPEILEINQINLVTKKWEKDFSLLKRKFTNFYGCPLIFGHIKNTLHYHYKRNFSGKIVHFGIIPMLIDALSKIANYSYGFVTFEAYENLNETKVQAKLDIYDIFICQSVMHDENKAIDASIIDTIDIIFIITPGELYTIYEKLFFPFDELTWILLCLTFIVSFCVILILKFFKKIFRNLFYGNETTTPTLNVVSIFFGISLTIIPTRNIPRFKMILFVGFCLIFRTCYQSKLFEFMTSEMRRPEIQTIDELFEKNYTVYSDNMQRRTLESIKNWQSKRIKYLPHDSIKSSLSIFKLLKDFNLILEKQAIITSSITHLQYEKYFETKFKVLKEPLVTSGVVLSMGINNFYSHEFYKLLSKLMPSGIPYHFTKMHKEIYFKLVNEKEEKEPKVLTLDDLDFGFFIWFPFIGISIIVFILELIIFKLTKKKKRFRKMKFAKVHPMVIDENQANENLKL